MATMTLSSLIFSAVVGFIAFQLLVLYRDLRRNIASAKASGLPYVVVPANVFSIFWLSTFWIWTPILRRIVPVSYHGVWTDVLDPEWGHRLGHEPYAKINSDVFLCVSPTKIICFVADAEVVTQITARRNDFPKPLEMYRRLDLYGKNLVSTEGQDWRMHRRIAAPSFGERNNELVFNETLYHTQALLRLWNQKAQSSEKSLDVASDTMRWALYIISGAGFNVRVNWAHEDEEEKGQNAQKPNESSVTMGSDVPAGHQMSYREALSELLHNIMWTMMGPPKFLKKSPIKVHRTVGTAVDEWGQYMEEVYEIKKEQVASNKHAEGMDIFQALIRASNITDDKQTAVKKTDIFGNAFVLMLAGHETTANSLHFSLILLAMNWSSQARLQQDVDKIIGGRPISEWKYEEDFPKLFGSMPAAVMNETLRVLQPIVNIPKSTAPGRPQVFTMGDRQYTMPGGTHVLLNCAIHRNPKYWPEPANETDHKSNVKDVDQFRPERWLLDKKPTTDFVDIDYDDEELRGPSGEDTSSSLFKPVRGSYIPFSDGYRSCIGRRFAQVELLAAFAVIFSQYSVELAVDEFASDDDVARMDDAAKEQVWKKAADKAQRVLRDKAASIITLQLRGATVPIRLVKRGEERFKFNV